MKLTNAQKRLIQEMHWEAWVQAMADKVPHSYVRISGERVTFGIVARSKITSSGDTPVNQEYWRNQMAIGNALQG